MTSKTYPSIFSMEDLSTDDSGSPQKPNQSEFQKVIVRVTNQTLENEDYTASFDELATHLVYLDSVLWLNGQWLVYHKHHPHVTRKFKVLAQFNVTEEFLQQTKSEYNWQVSLLRKLGEFLLTQK